MLVWHIANILKLKYKLFFYLVSNLLKFLQVYFNIHIDSQNKCLLFR